MDNISDINKKKTRRLKRNFTKIKRNLKKNNNLTTNLNTKNDLNSETKEHHNDNTSFFGNFFSWC